MKILPTLLNELPGITAGFSTREGGVSTGPFASLNLSLSAGDDPEAVAANRLRFFGSFGIGPDQIAVPGQVHGDLVRTVEQPGHYPDHDGLVTVQPRLALCIISADCAAVLLADAEGRVIGACHSGWRGTAAGIASKTIATMERAGADPRRIHAFVSPSIGPERFEVGPEVAEQFEDRYVERPDSGGRPHVDLKAAIQDQLTACGVPVGQIEVSPYCTAERTDLFYSYRAEGGVTGRMMGFVWMKEDQ